jgi:DNA-binding NtrC family response regulator
MSPVQTPKLRPDSARLLFVGNCADERHVLQRFLENWTIQSAKSCEQAIASIESERPTVVLCEEELPDGSWRRLLSSVQDLGDPSPPVIVLARRADERIWADVLRHGGFDVLSRPLDLSKARPAIAYAAERTLSGSQPAYSRRMAAQGY